MSGCLACGAPNPAGRTVCYVCGGLLSAAPMPPRPVPPDPNIRPCASCGRLVAVFHPSCPHCGGPSPHAAAPAVPPGWAEVPQPDGTVRLIRSTRRRGQDQAAIVLFAGLVGLSLVRWWLPHGPPTLPSSDQAVLNLIKIVVTTCLPGAAGLVFVWTFYGNEEWRVGSDFLEIRRELFGRRHQRRYGAARLAIHSYRNGRWPHERTCNLCVEQPGDRDRLHCGWRVPAADLEALGRYLSARTGWPLEIYAGWWSGSIRS